MDSTSESTLFQAHFGTFDWNWRLYRLFICQFKLFIRQFWLRIKPPIDHLQMETAKNVQLMKLIHRNYSSSCCANLFVFSLGGRAMNDYYFCRCRVLSIYDINDWLHMGITWNGFAAYHPRAKLLTLFMRSTKTWHLT